MAMLNVCIATADDRRSGVHSIDLSSSRREHSNASSPTVVPGIALDPSQRELDGYVATSVYSEIADNVYESVTAAADDDHGDNNVDYDVLSVESALPSSSQSTLTTTTVHPVYIPLLSDAEAEEINASHPPHTACITDNQVSTSSEALTV